MDYFDVINELRKGKPDIKKAEKAMKIMAWICIGGGIWNFAMSYIMPFQKSPFKLPPEYPYLALIIFAFLGLLFFRAARGIREIESWGRKTGQIAIVLFILFIWGFLIYVFPIESFPVPDGVFSVIFAFFVLIAFAQFAVPAYFGVIYLGRLPVKDDIYSAGRYDYNTLSKTVADNSPKAIKELGTNYKESLFPFGIFGTFIILMAAFGITMIVGGKFVLPKFMFLVFMPAFFFIFLAPVIYNLFPSGFEKKRTPVATFTGGGSVFLFNGTWPFFRLLVYNDGLEIRVMFHRYFIPYDEMDDIPDKVGFFNRGILIKSDLPDVPSGIRFFGFGMKKIIETVNNIRNRYMSGKKV